jgi:phospho-N-acetylmuramoyl-pentapeptide-transferase
VIFDLFELNVLRYITVRTALAALTAFAIGIALGPWLVAALRRRKIGALVDKGDSARLDELFQGKKGTPTMGGVLIVGATLVATLAFAHLSSFFVWLMIATMVVLAAIGLIDDWSKLHSHGRGMSARRKLLCQILVGLGVGLAMQTHYMGLERDVGAWEKSPEEAMDPAQFDVGIGAPGLAPIPPPPVLRDRPHNLVEGTSLYVPFSKNTTFRLGGALFALFAALVLVSTVNAVNFTDGLDGLAAGTSIFSLAVYVTIAYVVGRSDFSAYLRLPFVPGAGEAAVVGGAALGATLAFLWYNAHPAEVFMGDTGSLALGGLIAALALTVKQELLLLVAGGIFAMEGLSVVLQIASFKLTGKRIFRIAPIHHHFQFGGAFETKVTTRFWIVAAILAVVALTTLKVR